MKKISVLFALLFFIANATGCDKDKDAFSDSPKTEVPLEVLTPGNKQWYAGTLSSIYYYDRDNVPHNSGGFIVLFKFFQNGRYEQLTHFHHRTYQVVNRTWTKIEGTVVFKTDAQGYKTFTLYPVKGVWTKRTPTENYDDRPIPESELKSNSTMSTSYRYTTGVDPNYPSRKMLIIQNAKQNYAQTNLHWEE